ncbi:hypothetical protein ILUMI_20647 [Ignelater luminosus]|uniref:Mariner Mos1 transposase n=1 Tax=Ignelater luminosus TaxID=2038154 RepID=A0A8K0CHS8_IGNLU|nr:hypothetical protein ILUMI_20647 [Ignelater luminosus]
MFLATAPLPKQQLNVGGDFALNDDFRSGHSATAADNRYVTYVKIEETLGIHAASVHSILHKHLGLKKVCMVWVPHHVVTEDETWVYHYDIPTKQQAKQCVFEDEPTPTDVRRQRTTGERIYAAWWPQLS